MFVGGINCSAQNAYAEMIAVQRRFGLRGKVVGYGGTSKTGRQYHYYMCKNARRKKCAKKIVSKSYIEDRVVNECLKNPLYCQEGGREVRQKPGHPYRQGAEKGVPRGGHGH